MVLYECKFFLDKRQKFYDDQFISPIRGLFNEEIGAGCTNLEGFGLRKLRKGGGVNSFFFVLQTENHLDEIDMFSCNDARGFWYSGYQVYNSR